MLKRYMAVFLTAVSVMCAGCEQPPVEQPPVDKPPAATDVKEPADQSSEKTEPRVEPPKKTEAAPAGQRVSEMDVKVYYPDESGLRLVEVDRQIEVSKADDKYAAAVEAMMVPPTEPELTGIFPKHSKLLGVTVSDGVATVNFDDGLKKHFIGGSAGETFLIGSVVNALTNFDEVKTVRFLIDGEEIDTLAGHMDLSTPLTRMPDLMKGE